MSQSAIAIIGAGPYGLSLSAHLSARKIEHRIFGRPMQFWSKVAQAGDERYLKSYCFGTDLSSPMPGFSFADYNRPRGLETFEPCSMANFTAYGQWFQQKNVPWVESSDVAHVAPHSNGFALTLASGERVFALHVVVATGLAQFAYIPAALASLPPELALHSSHINSFLSFKGRRVAIIGAGQSALEAAALLHEVGASPELLVRAATVHWHQRVTPGRRSLWRRLRSPISNLGTGPKAWALTEFPGMMHRIPAAWRTRFVKRHLPAEGAWWLRPRVVDRVPMHFETSILAASEQGGRVALKLNDAAAGIVRQLNVDHVIAGSGFSIDVDRLQFLDPKLRACIRRLERAPDLDANFETSVPGLHFIGPTSAMSFGPLFRFVAGAEYTSRIVSAHLASQPLTAALSSAA